MAAAFALLVLVNVLVGIAFIIGSKESQTPSLPDTELAMRQQISASLQKTAETAMPPPTLGGDEILSASRNERETIANHVVMLATQCDGSAAKAPPDDTGITVLADLPASRADEFRRRSRPWLAQFFLRDAERNRPPTKK